MLPPVRLASVLFLFLHLSGFGVGGPDDEALPVLSEPLLLLHAPVTCQTQRLSINVYEDNIKKEEAGDNSIFLTAKTEELDTKSYKSIKETYSTLNPSKARIMTKNKSSYPDQNNSAINDADMIAENLKIIHKPSPHDTSHGTVATSSDCNATDDVYKTPGGGNLKHTPTLVDILLEYQGLPIHFLPLFTFLLCLP